MNRDFGICPQMGGKFVIFYTMPPELKGIGNIHMLLPSTLTDRQFTAYGGSIVGSSPAAKCNLQPQDDDTDDTKTQHCILFLEGVFTVFVTTGGNGEGERP